MSISEFVTKAASSVVSAPGFFESASRNLLVTFNYHEVSDNPSRFCTDFNLNVRPETFAKQLIWIKKYFNIISPQQIISGDYELPAALITFDDGFEGVFNQGAKILKEAGIPAIVFMNMAPVRGETCWSGLVTYLCEYDEAFKHHITIKYNRPMKSDFFLYCTREDVHDFIKLHGNSVLFKADEYHGKFVSENKLLSSAGEGIFLGNHLFNHYNAASLSSQDLTEQYLLNESIILEYKNYVPLFSYPFGQPQSCFNRNTDEILTSLGTKRLFTAFPLFNRDRHTSRIHRTAMFEHVNSESIFRAHCLVPACMNHLLRNNFTSKN